MDDLLDDPELDRLHAERLAALKEEAEKRAQLQRSGHGWFHASLCFASFTCHLSTDPCCPPFHPLLAPFTHPAGSYQEVAEGDFLEACTKAGRLVCHFFHREFERCKILDRHLTDLARRHLGTRFIKLSVMVSLSFSFFLLIDWVRVRVNPKP